MASATKAVFFDVDYTLIYPGPMFQAVGYRQSCERHGITVEEARYPDAVRAALSGLDHEQVLYDDAVFCAAFGLKESVIKVLGGLPKGANFQDIRLDRTDRGWGVSLRGHLAVFGAATLSGSMVCDAIESPEMPPLAWAAATTGTGA